MVRLTVGGDFTLEADQDTRIEVARFIECYQTGIRQRVERRRQAGQPVPDTPNLQPSVEID